MIKMSSKYAKAGVDVKKKGIEIFKKTIHNIFPNAFCVVLEDPDLPKFGLVTHADSAGSKPVQAYLHWKETSNIKWFKSLAQDVLAMNLNDIVCVGAQAINFIDYIALNPSKVPKIDLLKIINSGFKESLETLERNGIKVFFSGGETADLSDQLRTFDISGTINGRVELSKAIDGTKIKPGDVIVGLRSGGKTKYEKNQNSGIMCNGLTLARLCLMSKNYQKKYPEIADPDGEGYYGKYKFDHYLDELGMTVGEAIISPMRFFVPVINKILDGFRESISGLVHNMGGGLTKCLRIGKNIHYIKDNLIKADPIFKLIQKESAEKWKNMFENYNMGIGFEVFTQKEVAEEIIKISESFSLEAKIIGKCEKSDGKNKLTIKSSFGKFLYA
jgi:phosphoribosylformylglycinamidine cyclo-ligase